MQRIWHVVQTVFPQGQEQNLLPCYQVYYAGLYLPFRNRFQIEWTKNKENAKNLTEADARAVVESVNSDGVSRARALPVNPFWEDPPPKKDKSTQNKYPRNYWRGYSRNQRGIYGTHANASLPKEN